MNDILFDQKITAAFAALPPADDYLKARLLRLPDTKPAPRRFAPWKLAPIAAAVAAVVLIAAVLLNGLPRVNPELPMLQYESIIDVKAMGYEALMIKNTAELHRESIAYGRESELGSMAVYRNPDLGKQRSEADAMEIAAQFGRAMGRTYVYTPPRWLTDPELQQARKDKLELLPPEERERIEDAPLGYWEFRCGEDTLTVNSTHGMFTLTGPLPASLPKGDGTAARYEAMCLQIYAPYADAIEALTDLRFNNVSTALDYNIYGDKMFTTFLYVNNPGDSLARQAEDYALRRLDITVLEEMHDPEQGDQEAKFYLNFNLVYPDESDLLGDYPVLDLNGAKRALLDGNYESSVTATKEELARAAVEEAELIYSAQPWMSVWMPMYRLYLTFPPEDMRDWNNDNPELAALGLRNYYVFYVPAVSPEYIVPQEADDSAPRPAG